MFQREWTKFPYKIHFLVFLFDIDDDDDKRVPCCIISYIHLFDASMSSIGCASCSAYGIINVFRLERPMASYPVPINWSVRTARIIRQAIGAPVVFLGWILSIFMLPWWLTSSGSRIAYAAAVSTLASLWGSWETCSWIRVAYVTLHCGLMWWFECGFSQFEYLYVEYIM